MQLFLLLFNLTCFSLKKKKPSVSTSLLVTLLQMLYRRVEPDFRRLKDKGDPDKPPHQRVRFYFWIWALAPPKKAENYYYTVTIPRGQLQVGEEIF